MSKEQDALKLALEALKMCRGLIRNNIENLAPIASPNPWFSQDVDTAIAAAKEALAENPAQQQPTVEDNSQNWCGMDGTTAYWLIERHADGWADVEKMMGEWLAANQSPPPRKPWVGLTDETIEELCWTEMDRRLLSFARAVEAKLREKNA